MTQRMTVDQLMMLLESCDCRSQVKIAVKYPHPEGLHMAAELIGLSRERSGKRGGTIWLLSDELTHRVPFNLWHPKRRVLP